MPQGKQRSKLEREAGFLRISELYLKGKSQAAIASALGISQAQVCYDMRHVRSTWLKATAMNLDEAKAKELAAIDNTEREAWEAWERSLQDDVTKQKREKSVTVRQKDFDENIIELPANEVTRTLTRRGQSGNPAYLNIVMSCIDKRCKILGLDAPVRNDTRNFDVDLSTLTDEQLDKLETGEDIYKVLKRERLITQGQN